MVTRVHPLVTVIFVEHIFHFHSIISNFERKKKTKRNDTKTIFEGPEMDGRCNIKIGIILVISLNFLILQGMNFIQKLNRYSKFIAQGEFPPNVARQSKFSESFIAN